MEKKKVLIPLDGTDRSMHSIDCLKKIFSEKDNVKVTLMTVSEIVIANDMVISDSVIERSEKESKYILDRAEKEIEGYEVEKYSPFGYAGDEILKKAQKDKFDAIIMTKSTKKGLIRMIGSVTSKVVKNSKALVLIVPE
ncbi:nucleotide-binding universal stress UspA family protein [Clostridium algifaecis]|uniref:Nucleotide-binding universal stress UspA family protein n=1 Tax=Clostridium algifaecis TaxID=1472040 RepID=A0ABS4KT04_9CLOT|nr:universal stress protein [Clostridium algifaecis]MBP2033162.1 nucleotide-binding universal stress UspA family protein [Clostridium algifaecis]